MATFGELTGGRLRRSVIDPETGLPVITSAPTGEVMQRSALLPVGRDDAGRLVPAVPGLITGALDAATLPGRVARGEVSIFDPQTGHVSDRAVEQAADLAGLAMTGSLPFSAPAGALRTFGGRAARTADSAALKRAEAMRADGAAPDAIWRETGWTFGRDGAPRFEISDDAARVRPHDGASATTLGRALDHPALFEAYPEMRDVAVYHRPQLGAQAAMNPEKGYVALNLFDPDARASLLHEGQHLVQRREGFAPGANPADPAVDALPLVSEVAGLREQARSAGSTRANPLLEQADARARREAYRTAAGEVEARNVETRQAMTPAERRATPPASTEDVPAARQWVPPALAAGGVAALAAPGEARAAESPRPNPGAKMGLFDDLPDAPAASTTPQAKASGGLFDDVPDAKADPSALARAASTVGDVAQSAGAGLIRGAAGLADLPQNLYGLAETGMDYAAQGVIRAFGGTPSADRTPAVRSPIPSPSDLPRPGAAAVRGLEAVTEPLYEPKTVAGEYARTLTEFLPGAGAARALEAGAAAGAKTLAKTVAAPAVASETAGQATKGTAAEPWARAGAGLAAGVGAAVAGRPGVAERIFDRSAGKIGAEEVAQVQSLVADGQARGVALTWPEALQQVVGPRRMGDLMRVAEGQGRLQEFFAARPEQIRAAGTAALDDIGPAGATAGQVGEAAQAAARAGVAGTPEGQAVIRATQAAGPRVSADQAGRTIQREMRGVADAREARRAAQAETDYGAAREAPERIGVDRTVTVERPGEPVLQTFDAPPARAPEFLPPPEGPATLSSIAPTRPDAAARGGQGPSLARFIAENGGIGLERGDVKAAGLDRYRQPGVSNLVRQDGKGIDSFWRERLIEEGFLPPDRDGGMARNIHDELIGLLEQEAKGRKTYAYDYLGRDDLSGFGAARDEFQAAAGQATADIRAALREAGVDPRSVHKDIVDRAAAALVRGAEKDPLVAYERTVMAAREPVPRPNAREVSTTVTEEISAPRFGQANPQPALDALDRQIGTAKGDVRASLETIRRDLYEHGADPVSGVRETDLSVEGLLHARERLDQHIDAARDIGDRTKARDLAIVRASLDRQLKAVPEVATADANFAANSRPLEAFAGDTPLGRTTARDDLTGRMRTPAEQVPGQIQGATAAREFLANATPEARRAFEGRQVTRILDEVSAGQSGASADAIRAAIRQNEDILSQIPEARDRLQRLARAYQGREAVDRSPLGRIAERPDVKVAIGALFPTKPVEGSAREIEQAVSAMARSNPVAARQLVRTYLATEFAETTQRLQSGPAQAGGARFAARIQGNPLQAENLSAALRALPNGEGVERGFSRLVEILEATGQRQGVGSRTSFNTEALAELRTGGAAAEAGQAAATGGLKAPARIMEALQAWRLGKNLDRLAELMTSAEGGRRLAQLAEARPGASTIALLGRLTQLGTRTSQTGDRAAETEGGALRLTVRPGQ